MMNYFNQLTPAEAERLAMLAEECGEIIQVIGKILRHGYESYHPSAPEISNRKLLKEEIHDLLGVHLAMIRAGDITSPMDIEQTAEKAWENKLRYAHHQEDKEPK